MAAHADLGRTLAAASFFVLGLAPAWSQENGEQKFTLPHITASGRASVQVKPDIAYLNLGVVVEKPTPSEAVQENARAAAAAIATLKSLGVEPKDIRTISVSLDPVMVEEPRTPNGPPPKRTLTGYRATNFLKITFRDVDKAGAIVSRVVADGANSFRSFEFDVTDYTARVDSVRAEAVRETMRRAALYASGAHMKLGRLLAIDPEADEHNRSDADLPSRRQPPGQPTIIDVPTEPGLKEISAGATATWELVPE